MCREVSALPYPHLLSCSLSPWLREVCVLPFVTKLNIMPLSVQSASCIESPDARSYLKQVLREPTGVIGRHNCRAKQSFLSLELQEEFLSGFLNLL